MCLHVCLYLCVCEKEEEGKSHQITLAVSPHSSLCRAARLELGWDMQIQAVCLPAPSEAAEQHAASCTHTLTHAECRGLRGSSLVSRSRTRLHVCVYGAETFLETHSHTLPSFFPQSCSPLSPFPSSSTPLCCFPCPSSSPLPLQPH